MEKQNAIKLANLAVDVPYKGAGNVIMQRQVSFDIYKEDNCYKAVPLLSDDERRTANLPDELIFFYENGKPRSPRKIDGNFHVIEDLVAKLQQTSVMDALG